MRILHVHQVKGLSGSEKHLVDLAAGQQDLGHDVRIVALVAPGGYRFVEAAEKAGVAVASLPAARSVDPAAIIRLRKETKRFAPDIVHTHLIHADLHGQLAALGTGAVGISSVHASHDFYRREPYRSAARVAGHAARQVIAISHHVAELLRGQRIARPGAVRVVHYGIDTDRWTVTARERAEARSELGLSAGEVGIGIASRLVAHKGHEEAIEAFAQALNDRPSLRLLIAGTGPLRDALERRAAALPASTVRFLGWLQDVRTFLGACDVVLFPTQPAFGEGFGLAALEAMAVGRPLIASRVASLPEIVVDGRTGYLVGPRDAAAWAARLTELADDTERAVAMGEQGRIRARQAFPRQAMVDGNLEVYRDAAG